jgi:hypothetical protein
MSLHPDTGHGSMLRAHTQDDDLAAWRREYFGGVLRVALTPDEAAESAGVARTRIFLAIKAGRLTARKDGKCTLIEPCELQRWIRSLPVRGRQPVAEAAEAAE